jgi:hypothetical protein
VPTTLICDTLHNLKVNGETWQANVTNILNGPTEGLFKGNTLIDYKAAAITFSDILFHGANASDANWAIRALFTPRAKNSKYFNLDAWLSTTPPSRWLQNCPRAFSTTT